MPLAVIRPEPGCAASVAAARVLGLEAHGFPLFEVVARDWDAADPIEFDGLLVGSANAFRLGGAGLAALRSLPVHAVGKTTADAAREAGFAVATVGDGGLQAVLDGLRGPAHLLRLAGEERIALVPPAGIAITERVVYASEARAMPLSLAALLGEGAVVLLHSGEAARHFAAECERLVLRPGPDLPCRARAAHCRCCWSRLGGARHSRAGAGCGAAGTCQRHVPEPPD